MDPNGNRQTYYGRIEDIWELDYAANFKVPLFRKPVHDYEFFQNSKLIGSNFCM